MKTSAITKLRRKLAHDQAVYGLWVTLDSASISEMAVALGLDWIVVDAEHGHLDWKEILEHIRATVRSDTVVLVRVAELNSGLIKRALDIGADGVVVPWVETAEQLQRAVAYATYPPEGARGIGAERATCWGQCFEQHTGEANEHVLVVPIIESVTSGQNIQSMLKVPGIEIFFFGLHDYSSTAGYRGQWEGPGVAVATQAIKDAVRAAGKHCGIMTSSNEDLSKRRQQGFRMMGLGMDSGLLLRSLHGVLAAVGQDRSIVPSFQSERDPRPAIPMDRPPESLRPDRRETITLVGQQPRMEIAPGVEFECLVGKFNTARNLTTGLVTFQQHAELAYHTHTFTESVTVLSGSLLVEVEGRRYTLNPLDNITIPSGLAHYAQVARGADSVVAHVAMGTDSPTRKLSDRYFSRRTMEADSTGVAGAERVTRLETAQRSSPGAGASFVDYFNQELRPGLEMSGGYALFQPGGRLPAHIHDFDESICIIQGTATCVVEGRRYEMADCATALQPRGRVHYFINESQGPMAMIWVYAGPLPERIVVNERCATTEGDPWKDQSKPL
jgi:2-keto-3-deoxy-L-rhamnonate aldolase RhmA/quercetin dioxygenase-like cupin family protein